MNATAHSEALERATQIRDRLRFCELCPRRCGVDRLAGARGFCGVDAAVRWFREMVVEHEERGLNPSHQVYFAGCNLRCAFCSVEEWNLQPQDAATLDPRKLATVIERRRRQGAKTLNLLGGEPAVSLHGILELLSAVNVRTRVVWNSNMYYSEPVAEAMEGLADITLADLKVGNHGCAERLLGAEDYMDVVRHNIIRARQTSDVIVRHLLLPGHMDCCLGPILEWISREVPDIKVSLRFDYVPPAEGDLAPSTYLELEKRDRALRMAGDLGLHVIG